MSDAPANLHVMSQDSYDELKKQVEAAGGLCVIDFFAPWCGPCQRLVGELPKIAAENPKVLFIKVNVDDCQQLSHKFGVSSIPHVIFCKGNGGSIQQLATVVGFNIAAIKQNIQKFSA